MRSLFGMRWNQVCSETLILFQLLLLYFVCSSVYAAAFSEKWVLLQFKDSVSDPSGILSGWDSDSDHCSWYGVQCGPESRVSSLIITGGGRKGNSTLPTRSSFSHLPFYGFGIRKRRSVENGSLVGNLSPLIGKLTELRVLSLPFHGFSGEIPLEIWGLGKLEVLDLEGNSLTGNLPRHFPVLRKLRVLGLGFNSIAGEIPFSLSGCVGLQVLNLAGNELNGTIPPFVGSFPDLRGLYLSFNRLTGLVPCIFGNNSQNLEHVDLSGNLLSGEIPRSFGNCRRLKTLLLFSNLFNGSIPRHLGRLRQLEVLDVSRNSLSGPIPTELGGCLPLSVFVLSDSVPAGINSSNRIKENNHFQGSIPTEITNLPMLRLLWAPRAGLEGKFPSSWGSCGSLEMVNVAQNLFTGDISGLLGGCKKLHFLNLSSNRLTGKLDEKLPVPCMIVFDVSGNLLSGSIPRFNYCESPNMPSSNSHLGWSKKPSFAYISFYMYVTQLEISLAFSSASVAVVHNFAENRFTGPIPWLPIAPKRLLGKQIDYVFLAGGNKLSGLFPGHLFGKCDALNGLIVNISHNKVSGQIPLEVGRLCRSLKVLDASENEVSGSIPQSIGDIGALLVLNLSGNKLQGAIPVGLSRLKNLKYLSLARNNLTCTIPSSLRQLPSLKVLELSSNLHSGDNMRRLTPFLNNREPGKIPTRSADVMLNPKFNGSLNNLCGALLLISDLTNSSHIKRILSSSDMLGKSDESKNYAAYPSESSSKSGTSGLSSIEIASIISVSAIFSVLIALAILFFYTRKWMPNSRIQVSELKEIMVFVDPGVPLTFDNIVETTGNFSAGNCIGSGGFGATYKAEISPGILVAVKRLSVGRFVQGVQQFHAEIKTLGRIRHPNLVTLVGYHASQTEMFLIYNYLPGGNLENFIQERSETAVEWSTLHKIALDIAHALAYLHDECVPRVLHRDVKPSNILLDNDLNAYLSDFGLSRLMGASETHATTGVAGTFGYVAPEYAMTCRVSEKADVYSYGVVLLELISDKKALDPSFSSHGNGFNIVSWACMLLRQGEAKDVFTPGLWDAGPHDKLVEALHLAVMCTVESLSIRPTMKQVVQRLNQLHSPSR